MLIIEIRMDIKKDGMIPECGDLASLRKYRVLVGAKQIRKALDKGIALFVFLAENADPALTDPIAEKCKLHHIPCTWVSSMDALGKVCGIEVAAAAAAAVK